MAKQKIMSAALLSLITVLAASQVEAASKLKSTAYNSVGRQTDATPTLPACGPKYMLSPGKRYIAVSNNLWNSGLKCGSSVTIHGLGNYIVADRMHSRWHNKIDIYMGNDVAKARRWGKRAVTVTINSKVNQTSYGKKTRKHKRVRVKRHHVSK